MPALSSAGHEYLAAETIFPIREMERSYGGWRFLWSRRKHREELLDCETGTHCDVDFGGRRINSCVNSDNKYVERLVGVDDVLMAMGHQAQRNKLKSVSPIRNFPPMKSEEVGARILFEGRKHDRCRESDVPCQSRYT